MPELFREPLPFESQHNMARSLLAECFVQRLVHEITQTSDALVLYIERRDVEATVRIVARRDQPGRLDFEVAELVLRPGAPDD